MSAGLIKLKNKSSEIIGSETDFKTDLADGDLIVTVVGGVTYTLPVKTVTDATHLTLVRDYDGPDQNGAAWTAMPRETVNRITGQMAADASYLVRSRVLEVNNWYQLLEVNGDVAIKMADGSTYTGPSWLKICDLVNASDLSKIQPLADQIHTDATQVATDRTAADNSAKAAASSATGAASSATAAKGSSDAAGTSATAAAKSASDAAGSASAAKGSADTAGGSATAAAKSAQDAASSATAAKGSADAAGSSMTTAAESASDAAGSASAAKGSADTAGGSATAAAKSATDAAGSASAAKDSAGAAGSSATAAASSASSAKTSADHAAGSAADASESADRAEAAARNATAGTVKSVNDVTPDEIGNVKLGTAADADIVESMIDTTAGRALVAGYGGWGIANGTTIFLKSIFDIACSGVYNALGKGNETPTEGVPDDSGNTRYAVLATNVYASLYWVTLISNKEYYVGNVDVSKRTAAWNRFYCTGYKQTAADTGAMPLDGKSLDDKTDLNTLGTYASAGIHYQALNTSATTANHYPTAAAGTLFVTPSAYGCQQMYITYSNRIFVRALTGQFNGSGPWTAWVEIPSLDTADGRYLKLTGGNVTGSVSFGNAKKFAINPQNNSTLNAHLNFWGNADRPTVLEFGDDTSYHFYSQRNKDGSIAFVTPGEVVPGNYSNFDGRYQAKGNYTPAGQAYTKAESDGRYAAKGSTPDLSGYMTTSAANAKYVTATRQSADVSLRVSANATTATPAGSSMSGLTLSTSSVTGGIHVTSMYHRTTQYCINGTWYNSGKVSIAAPVMAPREPERKEKITRISNLSPYTPETGTEFFSHDGQGLSVERLISAEGYDWYQVQSLITGDHFIAYDGDGVIRQISQDVSYLTPGNLSVAGLLNIPEDCDIDGSWKYDGKTVQQDAAIVAARVLADNEGLRNKYIQQAVVSIVVLQAGVSCNRSLDGDAQALPAWQNYLCDLREMTEEELRRVDVVFPDAPALLF